LLKRSEKTLFLYLAFTFMFIYMIAALRLFFKVMKAVRHDKRMNIRFWKRINHEPHERHELLLSNCRKTFMFYLFSWNLKV